MAKAYRDSHLSNLISEITKIEYSARGQEALKMEGGGDWQFGGDLRWPAFLRGSSPIIEFDDQSRQRGIGAPSRTQARRLSQGSRRDPFGTSPPRASFFDELTSIHDESHLGKVTIEVQSSSPGHSESANASARRHRRSRTRNPPSTSD